MAITFRHEAAGIAPSDDGSRRKYTMQLLQDRQKYAQENQRAAQNRWWDAVKTGQQQAFETTKQERQIQAQEDAATAAYNRDVEKTKSQRAYEEEQKRRSAEDARTAANVDYARKMLESQATQIMEDINNGLYDDQAAQVLKDSIMEEYEILGNPTLDPVQRAEGLAMARGRRAMYLGRKKAPKAVDPAAGIFQHKETGQWFRPGRDGTPEPFTPEPQESQAPTSWDQLDEKQQEKWRAYAQGEFDRTNPDGKKSDGKPLMFEDIDKRAKEIFASQLPPSAQQGGGSQPPAAPSATDLGPGGTTAPPASTPGGGAAPSASPILPDLGPGLTKGIQDANSAPAAAAPPAAATPPAAPPDKPLSSLLRRAQGFLADGSAAPSAATPAAPSAATPSAPPSSSQGTPKSEDDLDSIIERDAKRQNVIENYRKRRAEKLGRRRKTGPMEMPGSPNQLRIGQVYIHPKSGPVRWDGQNFLKVKP